MSKNLVAGLTETQKSPLEITGSTRKMTISAAPHLSEVDWLERSHFECKSSDQPLGIWSLKDCEYKEKESRLTEDKN